MPSKPRFARLPGALIIGLAWLGLASVPAAHCQPQKWRAVPAQSSWQIEVGKAGWLKAFGDDHLIDITEFDLTAQFDPSAPAQGRLDISIAARGLKVRDPSLAAEKRAEVQQKMQGPEVLDIARFPAIRFVSRRISAAGANRWRIEGELQIRNAHSNVVVTLTLSPESGGYRARGEAPLKLSAFGIAPPSAAAGGVRVKDELKLTFSILLTAITQ